MDFGYSYLATGILSTDLTAQLSGGNINEMPDDGFYGVIYDDDEAYEDAAQAYGDGKAEIIYCTSKSGSNITAMTRGMLGTTARDFNEPGHTYKIICSISSPLLIPKGGTTGQVLKKASDSNYDVAWAFFNLLSLATSNLIEPINAAPNNLTISVSSS